MPSGRLGALAAVTSQPVSRFRCGSLVSPLGAGGLRLRRRCSRTTCKALSARGRTGWRQPLFLWLGLGDGKQDAGSNPPRRAGSSPGTGGVAPWPSGKCSSAPNRQWEADRRGGWGRTVSTPTPPPPAWGSTGSGLPLGQEDLRESAAVSAAASRVRRRTAEAVSGWRVKVYAWFWVLSQLSFPVGAAHRSEPSDPPLPRLPSSSLGSERAILFS